MKRDLSIRLVAGKDAPRYNEAGFELVCEEAIITEQATVNNLPIVDFKMRGPDGKMYLLVLSGRIVNGLARAIRGVNMRIHGVEEP